jgi:hypothetical protein
MTNKWQFLSLTPEQKAIKESLAEALGIVRIGSVLVQR